MYNSGVSIDSPFIRDILMYGGKLSDACFIILMFLAVLPLLTVALNVLFKGEEEYDWSPLFNLIKVALILKGYTEIMSMVSMAFGGATEVITAVMPSKAMYQEAQGFTDTVERNTSDGLSMWDYMTMQSGSVFRSIFSFISSGAIDLTRIVIERLRLVMMVMAYMIGPLAILVSVIPGKKDTIRIWFNAYFFIQCLPITLVLIDLVYLSYNKYNVKSTSEENFILFVAMQVVFIASYLMIAVWTTFFTGMNVAAGAMSKVVALSTAVVSMAQKSYNTASSTASKTGSTVMNAPTSIVKAAEKFRDTKDQLKRNHSLAKEIIRSPAVTLGFKTGGHKSHSAGI